MDPLVIPHTLCAAHLQELDPSRVGFRTVSHRTPHFLDRHVAIDLIIVVANAIACATFGLILWWAYGRVRSYVGRALIGVGTAVLAYIVYFLVHIVGEELFPAARGANGHIIAYDVHVFTLILIVVAVVVLFLRKSTRRATQ